MRHLGLKDNPFEPRRLLGAEAVYITELDRKALRVDVCPVLEKLYFEEFPVAQVAERSWHENLDVRGYSPGEQRSNSCFIALIRGRRGSGKTTLAASFLRYLHRCRSAEETEWKRIEYTFRDRDIDAPALTNVEIAQGCEKLRQDFIGIGADQWASVLIDNVSLDALGPLLDVYSKATCFRVVLLVGDEIRLLDDPLNDLPIEQSMIFETEVLDIDSAVKYAQARIFEFRLPEFRDGQLCDAMFPLLDAAVRRWHAYEPGALDLSNPLVVRGLNSTLKRKIDQLGIRFKHADIANLPAPTNVTLAILEAELGKLG